MSTTENRSPFLLKGLGWFNVFFIAEFMLAAGDWISLSVAWNALLIVCLLVPQPQKLRFVQQMLGWAAAAVLLYGESWLPPVASLLSNTQNILGFSWSYLAELASDFVNGQMLLWLVVLAAGYAFLRRWVRVSVFTVLYFTAGILTPWAWQEMHPADTPEPLALAETAATETTDANTIAQWYDAFIAYEKDRKAALPAGLSAKDTPFDIVLLNICSLSNDDLEAAELSDHGVFSRFNLVFDHFNSATSYSGPATLRLLNMACGQPSHDELYAVRPECQIMNRLERLGFKERLMMDHAGEYDDYLKTLRDKAGLTAPVTVPRQRSLRYMAFDDEPIADDLTVLRDWLRVTRAEKNPRTVTLMNFISLHDGNRLPRHGRSENFKPRAKLLLDQLATFMREVERSGRKVLLIVVPEHGAAVRGDRIQMPRLRDIPSLKITEVPVLVKFFGLKELPTTPVHVTGSTSYLALGELIGRVLADNYFSSPKGTIDLADLAASLPRTNAVSENAQAQVLSYKGRDYLKRGDKPWTLYPH